MVRPKFISRAARSNPAADPAQKEVDEEAQRRADADALVEAQIQKDIAARAAGKKHWDDSDSEGGEVDDADGVDPEAEYAAWKLRELRRLKRSREAVEAREREIAEKERRQGLTEEERAAEDEALVARQREEKEGRGKMGFMQKYYHRGAFYQDDLKTEGLDKRDLMGARFADEVKNRELLPQALQMRDMTKLGKKGATKYRDLKSEDTGSWGRFDDPRRQRDQWGQYRDGDRDGDRGGGGGAGGQGANAMPLGRRRSRSPRQDRDRDDHNRERKREYSRERDRHEDDKRRRVDSR
jgi:microfibrillar-associated protein 1